jgi:hypothetical protein
VRFGLGIVLAAFSHMPWGFFGWGFDWFGHSLMYGHAGWYPHSRSVVDWGLPHGGARYWAGRGNTIAGRGSYGRPGYGYGGRPGYDNRAVGRYTPRSFNPGNSAEGWRRYGATNESRTAQAFNRAPAFNARPGYNMPSRSFAPSRLSPGYDSRSFQSYNRGQTMNSFRQSAPRSMPSYRAYGGNEAFSRGGFDQRSSRSYGDFDQRSARSSSEFSGGSRSDHFSGGQHFSGGNHSAGGGHFSGGHSGGSGHSSHSGGGHHR